MASVDLLERVSQARNVWFEIRNAEPTSKDFRREEMLRAAIVQNGWARSSLKYILQWSIGLN